MNGTEQNKSDNRNAGFSLVELIIVVAIMAVLVGALAPQFIKYVENSRRTLDVSNANEIRETVLVLVADHVITTTGDFEVKEGLGLEGIIPDGEIPTVQGNVSNKGGHFWARLDTNTGICSVFNKKPVSGDADCYDLTSYEGSEAYRNAN